MALLGLLFLTLLAAPPKVVIERPLDGWTTERKIVVEGTVSDTKITRATLALNGTSFLIKVEGGRFKQKVVVSGGQNTAVVEAVGKGGASRAAVTFQAKVPKVDLKVYLMFDPQPFYIDLWVTEPAAEGQKPPSPDRPWESPDNKVWWASRESKSGGVLHDLYNDLPGGAVGMGPQAYTIANAPAGKYLVQVNYWAGGWLGEGEVGPEGGSEGPYGQRAQPLIPIRVETVLYEGTDREERRSFEAVLSKPSDTYTVAELEVVPPAERGRTPVRLLPIRKLDQKGAKK